MGAAAARAAATPPLAVPRKEHEAAVLRLEAEPLRAKPPRAPPPLRPGAEDAEDEEECGGEPRLELEGRDAMPSVWGKKANCC